jgi:hypothetical protein
VLHCAEEDVSVIDLPINPDDAYGAQPAEVRLTLRIEAIDLAPDFEARAVYGDEQLEPLAEKLPQVIRTSSSPTGTRRSRRRPSLRWPALRSGDGRARPRPTAGLGFRGVHSIHDV